MKKQLLKLFNEAGFHQPEMERLGVEHKFEKFAELIVRECALIAGLMEHEGRKNIGAQILDNFGVAQSNIEIAESYHSDKGYSLGTPEAQESFERKRGYKL